MSTFPLLPTDVSVTDDGHVFSQDGQQRIPSNKKRRNTRPEIVAMVVVLAVVMIALNVFGLAILWTRRGSK